MYLIESASAGAHFRSSMPCLPYSMVAICAVTFCALRPISGSPVVCKRCQDAPQLTASHRRFRCYDRKASSKACEPPASLPSHSP